MIFFLIIFLVVLAGYLAGQYFYSQKIKPQNLSQTSLIAPLINEKKNINNNNKDSNQYVIIPKIDNKKENLNSNISSNITISTKTTTSNSQDKNITTNKENENTLSRNQNELGNQNTTNKIINENNQKMIDKVTDNQETENNKEKENNKETKSNSNFDINPDNQGDYYIQVGLFSVYNNAKYVSETLKNKGIPCSIDEVIIKNVKMYRVIVGPFKNIDKANNVSKIIENEGFNPLVRKF
ncbi:MAG: SPOR domain-containing protein [bacterium]